MGATAWATDLFRALFDHLPDAMMLADERGRCVAANLAACDYLQRPACAVVGKLVAELTAQAPQTAGLVWQRFVHDGRSFHLTIVRAWRHIDAARPPTPPLHITERAQIELALAEAEGNVTRAARLLGIDRRTLQRRINPR